VELAKCFLELSDFQAGYRRTVRFFVARLNPGHENSWKQFSLFFSPLVLSYVILSWESLHCAISLDIQLLADSFLPQKIWHVLQTYWLGCNDAFRWKNADPFWNWSSLTEVRPLTSQPYQSE
jgi:hypothetical protein